MVHNAIQQKLLAVSCYLWIVAAATNSFSTAATNIMSSIAVLFAIPSIPCFVRSKHFREPLIFISAILWLWLTLAIVWSEAQIWDAFHGWTKYREFLFVALIYCSFRIAKVRPDLLLNTLAISGLSTALLSIGIWLQAPYIESSLSLLFNGKVGSPDNPTFSRSYITQGAILITSGFIFIFKTESRLNISNIAKFLCGLICLVTALVLLPGRTAILMLIGGGLVTFSVAAVKRDKRLLGYVSTVTVFLILSTGIYNPNVLQRTSTHSEVSAYLDSKELNSPGIRIEQWKVALTAWADAPIIGHGTGSFASAFQKYGSQSELAKLGQQSHPHSEFLNIATQGGGIGLFLWTLMGIFSIRLGTQMLAEGSWQNGGLTLAISAAFLCGSAVNSFMWDSAHGILGAMVFSCIQLLKSEK